MAAASIDETAKSSWQGAIELPENRLALQAVRRLARRAAVRLLMIHGPTGVGKSLLVSGLIRKVIQGPSVRTVQSLAANELAFSLESDVDLDDLQSVDVLIVEDLQHLPTSAHGKFEKLLDRRRGAMLVTANAGPAALKKLPSRLVSRLAGGLVVGIEPYSAASRKVILEHAAIARHVPLEPAALDWLAARPTGGSMRPLLGILDSLKSQHRGRATPLTLDDVKKIPHETPLDLARIVKCVAETYGVKTKELLGSSRLRTVLLPRHVAMFLARDLAETSLPRIGEHFGGRDHTTVLHAVNKIRTAMAGDRQLAGTIRQLRLELA